MTAGSPLTKTVFMLLNKSVLLPFGLSARMGATDLNNFKERIARHHEIS